MSKDYGNFKQTKTNKDLSIEASSVYIGGAYLDNVINYSTEEKVVGTWIDGKPIYRKVIITPKSAFTAQDCNIAHNISNMGNVIRYDFYYMYNNTWRKLPSLYWNDADRIWQGQMIVSTTELKFELGANVYNRLSTQQQIAYAILEYTKTTD